MNSDSAHPKFLGLFMYRWLKVATIFFLIAAILGTLMRYIFVSEIPFFDYRNLLHAHSHVALLGWGYMLMSGAILFLFIKRPSKLSVYNYLFIINIVTALGMTIFFTYQGYGAFSITFSAIHVISVYVFAFYYLRDLKNNVDRKAPHYQFVKWAVIWLVVSTIGVWAIAPVSALLGKAHPLYYMAIQFFLHFQFNGWLTFGLLGLLYHFVSHYKTIQLPSYAFWLLQISLLLTYALSVTFSTPVSILFYLNSLGVIIQAVAFFIVLKPIFKGESLFTNNWIDWLFFMGLSSLIVKVCIQTAVAIPAIAEISYTIRNYVIGFIHLAMLGSISLTTVAILLKKNLLPSGGIAKAGWLVLGLGFVCTELLLFGQGTLLWMEMGFINHYYEIIFAATMLLPVGLAIVIVGFKKTNFKLTTTTN